DPAIRAARERQKRNLITSLFCSQGVPMLLAGDELGRTQGGNHNPYCQDNATTWIDWYLDDARQQLLAFTRRLIALRRAHPTFRRATFLTLGTPDETRLTCSWLRPDGRLMTPDDWSTSWAR